MSPARQAAFAILLRITKESAYAVELLHSQRVESLSPVDRNLTQEIVMGVLRWQSLLDSSFAGLVTKPLGKLDPEVLIALRIGAYQLAFLHRIPTHAIVNESVTLTRQNGKTSAAGLVNAVLRKLGGDRHDLACSEKDLAHNYAHPAWLIERWVTEFGRIVAEKICRFDQQIPSTAIRINSQGAEETLRAEGVQLTAGALMKQARVVAAGDLTRSRLLSEESAAAAIQDEGSQLIAALVGTGRRILDCCAAPGGKTAAIAFAQPQAQIFAVELHAQRARLLRKLAPQMNVHVFTADARFLPFHGQFDCILVDAPCSGTGTLARNPEIKWRLSVEDLEDLQRRQAAILNSALRHLVPGGRLIYSTCSLETEENERVVEIALKENQNIDLVPAGWELQRLKDCGALVWRDIPELVRGDFLRTIPGVHPCDGFFAAILKAR